MKKKNSWILFIFIFIIINIVTDIIPASVTDGFSTGRLVPIISIFVFFLIIGSFLKKHGISSKNPQQDQPQAQPIKPKKPDKKQSPLQVMYDEDSFKIDPDDYKI